METKQIIVNGVRLRYQVHGQGRPVMLVHGFGENPEVWKQQVEVLKAQHKVIVPELPGSGTSKIGEGEWSMERFAELLAGLIREETRGNCIVIGHSMGGYITLALANQYPELLDKFGLVHSSAVADSEEKKATRRKGIAFILEHGAFAFLKTSTPNLFSPRNRDEKAIWIDEYIGGLDNFEADALVKYYEAMIRRPDRTALLKTTSLPVLFIMGKYDTAVPVEDGLRQCYLPGLAYIHMLQNSGHMGMLEEPDELNKALLEFCS